MPFVTDAYLKYLEQQMMRAYSAGGGESLTPPDIPTPGPTEPSGVPNVLPPGQGGPGSYPAGGPTPNEGGYPSPIPSATPVSFDPNVTPNQWGPNQFSDNAPPYQVPTSMSPGAPNDEVPLPTGGVTPSDLVNPPATLPPGVPPPPAPVGGPQGYPPATQAPPPPTGAGVGYNPAGVNLSPNDRINIILNSLGLPPLPAGYDPTGGLPAGFTESNRFGGGAPVFTGRGDFGPNFGPGGSIFSGRGLPIVPGTTAGPGNLGGGGGSIDVNSIGGKIFWHAAMPQFGGLTYAQVARMHPEWLAGLSNMGMFTGEGSPSQKAAAGPTGSGKINTA